MADIEKTTNLRKVLEEKVLDNHMDLTLRELLDILKKESHEKPSLTLSKEIYNNRTKRRKT